MTLVTCLVVALVWSFHIAIVTVPVLLAAWWLVRTDRAGFEAVLLVAGVGLTLVFPAAGHFDGGMLGTTWLVTGLAALAYTSLFALMGALTDRGVLAGLVYVVGWESIVASTDLPFRYATVAYWVRSIVDQQGHVSGGLLAGEIADPATLSTSILVLVGIAAGAALVGTLWFQRRELAGAEPE
jgi:hypothetical protein